MLAGLIVISGAVTLTYSKWDIYGLHDYLKKVIVYVNPLRVCELLLVLNSTSIPSK